MTDLTAEELRQLLSYDPETGELRWLVRVSLNVRVGHIAGYVTREGRRHVAINRRMYKAHRLAWLHVHGEWPSGMLDHVNGNALDNRISNLREANRSENGMNRRTSKNNIASMKRSEPRYGRLGAPPNFSA